jgi:glycosyltransferase involved in cell wall biosynthesis
MKVLHVINTLSAGGAELHLLTLCRYLRRQGIELVVACLKEQIKGSRSLRLDFEQERIRIVNLQAASRCDWRFLGRIVRLLKEERPDILHTHLPRADLAGAFARLFCPSIPWICSVHAIYSQSWSGRCTLPFFNCIWRQADSVVAISHAVKDWLVRERCVPLDKTMVIHYGIEPERFFRANQPLKKAVFPGSGIVGSIGRLEAGKGHDSLIEAMPIVCKEVPHASLLIAGHDPWSYGPTLDALINRLGLKERV